MSRDAVLAAISGQPITIKQLCNQLHMESGVMSHRLNSLIRKGLIERKVLEIRYRPFGYTRQVASDRPTGEKMRWPAYSKRCADCRK
jgi:predicted transcriptional regulator